MKGLKSYFHPTGKKGSGGKNGSLESPAVPVEMTTTLPRGSMNSLGAGSLTSRPSLLHPPGDFRNSAQEDILDIKSEVMTTWLHQQQKKRLWTTDIPGEGVVLKKARANYACSPEILHRETGGLFDQAIAMNVKVCIPPHIHLGVC
jgi:hypothetical protein